ncbi:MAG: hypothetical protein K6A98_05340 [Prevotella sp.]|nr:hypothetical protein [Prevotella sp.]
MAIFVTTGNPESLLNDIRDSIEKQNVQTWSVDVQGDFTHVSQWKEKAWFRAYVRTKRLVFGLIGRKDEAMTKMVYGLYHGRFSEMLLTHFDANIEDLNLTPKGVDDFDSFK